MRAFAHTKVLPSVLHNAQLNRFIVDIGVKPALHASGVLACNSSTQNSYFYRNKYQLSLLSTVRRASVLFIEMNFCISLETESHYDVVEHNLMVRLVEWGN